MLKKIFTIITVAVASSAFAQTTKPVLTVENFTGNVGPQAIEMLRNNVIAGVQQAGRVEVVDIKNETALKAEQARREREEAMADAGRVDDMTALMSNAILKGNIDNLVVTQRESKNAKTGKITIYFAAEIKYTLSIINASNGTLVVSKTFENTASADTQELAATECLSIKQKPLERFINNAYKVEGKILAIDEADAKKVKTLYVNLGSNDGIQKGQKLEVFKEIDIAGEISKKLIGELKILEVMGASRSLCKVDKGGDVILVEHGKGTNMPIRTKEQKSNFFSSMIEN